MVSRATKQTSKRKDRKPSKPRHHAEPWNGIGLATINQACDYLKCSRTKLYELINAKELKTVPIGRDQRVTADSLKHVATHGSAVLSPSAKSA